MNCPKCNSNNDAVIDSRSSGKGERVYRRRKCISCGARWSTLEISQADMAVFRQLLAQATDMLSDSLIDRRQAMKRI